ncbi:MAG: hypothetical protein Q9M25_00080 [Mariprofundaceae bacterium]|nr:hypothetical protein [Mariprofundaceae bacterium]
MNSAQQVNDFDTWIVRVCLPDRSVVRFQGMLCGEDGLATLRSQGGGPGEHELWSTRAQQQILNAWLDSLPESLDVEVVSRYAYRPENADRGEA